MESNQTPSCVFDKEIFFCFYVKADFSRTDRSTNLKIYLKNHFVCTVSPVNVTVLTLFILNLSIITTTIHIKNKNQHKFDIFLRHKLTRTTYFPAFLSEITISRTKFASLTTRHSITIKNALQVVQSCCCLPFKLTFQIPQCLQLCFLCILQLETTAIPESPERGWEIFFKVNCVCKIIASIEGKKRIFIYMHKKY